MQTIFHDTIFIYTFLYLYRRKHTSNIYHWFFGEAFQYTHWYMKLPHEIQNEWYEYYIYVYLSTLTFKVRSETIRCSWISIAKCITMKRNERGNDNRCRNGLKRERKKTKEKKKKEIQRILPILRQAYVLSTNMMKAQASHQVFFIFLYKIKVLNFSIVSIPSIQIAFRGYILRGRE